LGFLHIGVVLSTTPICKRAFFIPLPFGGGIKGGAN
jgi:hypothetical protein